jgi:NAD(P)-dependent dehydrogenase (short-subunit alcohol dehydrogenase family)
VLDSFRLDGRTALVTGASRGIGAAVARRLDQAGARVALVARNRASLEGVAAGLAHEPLVLEADLAGAEAPPVLADSVLSAFGPVDVPVNNAAVAHRAPTVELDAEVIDRLYAVNVRAPLLLIAALIPAMIERGGGAINYLSSVSGVTGTPGRAAMPRRRARSTPPPARWPWSSGQWG